MCNGALAGAVAICAGANTVYPWAAWVIGFIGGLVYKTWSHFVAKAGIDDPLDAAAVSFPVTLSPTPSSDCCSTSGRTRVAP